MSLYTLPSTASSSLTFNKTDSPSVGKVSSLKFLLSFVTIRVLLGKYALALRSLPGISIWKFAKYLPPISESRDCKKSIGQLIDVIQKMQT
jgi:hypothetical protein